MKLDWPRCWKRITVIPPSTVNALVAVLPRPLIVCALGADGAAVVGASVDCGSVVAGSVASVVWATVVFGDVVGFGFGSGSGNSRPMTKSARTISPTMGQGRRYHGLRGFCGGPGGGCGPHAGCWAVGGP